MTGDELRKSILAAAVRGALCPQEETDEPASALLARIREEKKKLIQEGKRKKEKNPTEIVRGTDGHFYERGNGKETDITDDLPFDIPDSWEWVRLGDIFKIEMGQSPDGDSVTENPGGMEFHQGKVFFGEQYLRESGKFTSAPTKIAPADSVLLCVRAPVGKVNITEREICIGRGLCAISPLAGMPLLFVYYSLLAYENIFVKQATGTTFVAITADVVKKQLFPVPPLAEQKRIVERLETLRPLIDEYTRIETEETARRKALPDDIKKSVLAHAVRGALCPQDETDEPASALLSRIREEKKKLVQEGKRKKEKNPTELHRGPDGRFYETTNGKQTDITDDLPFDIPDSWEWVRLGEISTYAETKQKVKAKDLDPSIWSLDLEDIEKGGKIIARKTLGERKATGDKAVFKRGDILYSKLRPYLLKVLIAPDDGICSPEMIPFHLYGGIIAEYIVYYLKSPKVDLFVNSHTYGMKMPRVGTETMAGLFVPVPPLAEQKRIAARLTQILSALENLR